MESFEGECVGGPWDKQRFAYWKPIKTLLRPMTAMSMNENSPVEAVEIGEYRLNDFGQWHWHETDAGKAMRTLFPDASKK